MKKWAAAKAAAHWGIKSDLHGSGISLTVNLLEVAAAVAVTDSKEVVSSGGECQRFVGLRLHATAEYHGIGLDGGFLTLCVHKVYGVSSTLVVVTPVMPFRFS